MAKIAEYGGYSDDQSNYNVRGLAYLILSYKIKRYGFPQNIAKQYVQEWTDLASASDQLVLSYGSGSSELIYNLYADKLLQLNLIDSSVSS